MAITITSADSPYSFGCTTAILLVDTSGGAVEIRLPPAINVALRLQFRITKITTDSNAVTITPFAGDTLNQATSYSFTEPTSVILYAAENLYWTLIAPAPNPASLSVKDFGAVGDGSTDDREAIQDAIDCANALGGGVVNFPRGNYRVASQGGGGAALVLKSKVALRGELASSTITIVATTTQLRGILTEGDPGTPLAVAGTIAKGALSFFASTTPTSLSTGDWINVYLYETNYADVTQIDWAQVRSVSGTTINVYTSFQQTFSPVAGQTLYYEKRTDLTENVEISGLHLKLESSGITTGTVLVSPYWARGVNIFNNVFITSPGTVATGFIAMYKCADARIHDNRFILTSSTVGGDVTGGGVELAESVDVIFDNNILESESSTTNGILLAINFGTTRFQITNNHINNAQDFGIITYAHPNSGIIANNVVGLVRGIGTGISLGGTEDVICEGNVVLGSTNGASFGIISSTDSTPVTSISPINNVIRNNVVSTTQFTTPYQTTYRDRCDQWQDIPYADLLFTMNVVGGTWNVGTTDLTYFRYITYGNQRVLDFSIDSTTVSGTAGSGLRVSLPFAFSAVSLTPVWAADSGTATMATALLQASTTMTFRRSDLANWNNASTNNTSVQGQVVGKY